MAAAAQMRANGVRAAYLHLRPPSDAALRRMCAQQLARSPPLGYDGAEAAEMFYSHVTGELAAADAARNVWDADITLQEDPEAAYCCLMEAVADRFAAIVPPCHVWGFGRQLWDRSRRAHGRRPLCVLVLGPAAVGKTTVAARVAASFGLVHLNAGALLFDEVAKGTQLGRRAKRYLDASVLVPDDVYNELIWARLAAEDAQVRGADCPACVSPSCKLYLSLLNGGCGAAA